MDLESSPEAVDDSVLDHHLRTALQVDPSPVFVARVRARVTRETHPGRLDWWSLRGTAAVAVAAAILLAAVAVHRQTRPARAVAANPAALPAQTIVQPTPTHANAAAPFEAVRHRSSRREPARAGAHSSARTGPPDERRALRILLGGVEVGDAMAMAVLAGPPAVPSAPEPIPDLRVAPLSVPPVTIDPLPLTQ